MVDRARLYGGPDERFYGMRAPEAPGMGVRDLGMGRLANVLAGALGAVWGSLPPEARHSYSSLAHVLAELSPGAAVRDTLQSSGEMGNALIAGDPWGALGGGVNMLTAMAGVVPGMRSISSMGNLRGLLKEAEPVYLRWSRGPKYDLKPGARSRNQVTGQLESGLSATPLTPNDDSAALAKLIREYEFLRLGGSDIAPHLYTGRKLGVGGDNEPVIAPIRHLGTLAPDFVRSATDDSKVRRLVLQQSIEQTENILRQRDPAVAPRFYERIAADLMSQKQELDRLGGALLDDPLVAP